MKKILLIFCVALIFTSNTYAGRTGKILNALTKIPIIGRGFEDLGNHHAHVQIDKKVNELYQKALSCNPLEIDHEAMIDARDWMAIRPASIDWRSADRLTTTAYDAKNYAATKVGSDKTQHCYAGCFIRKKIDYKAAHLLAWLKELQDSSDCNPNTHFEKADYEATLAGAIAGALEKDCDLFCGDENVKAMSGQQMLEYSYEYVKSSERD